MDFKLKYISAGFALTLAVVAAAAPCLGLCMSRLPAKLIGGEVTGYPGCARPIFSIPAKV